jgi:hypothetical protein
MRVSSAASIMEHHSARRPAVHSALAISRIR